MNNKKERKKIKKMARNTLRRNYFKCIIVLFVVGFIINGGYSYTTVKYNKGNNVPISFEKKDNYDVINETLSNIAKKDSTNGKDNISGLIAPIVNSITESKSIAVGFLNSINMLLFKSNISAAIISFLAGLVSLVFYFYVRNIIIVGSNRYFLEQKLHNKSNIMKITFPFNTGNLINIAFTLFLKSVYGFLWDLTIVGGFIKHYEYFMIPYILAENPSINYKDAFKLSKELMYGEKMNTFKLDLSMFFWHILSLFTLGLSATFYSNAYIECVYAELYMNIRNRKKDKLFNKELLNDIYLEPDYYEQRRLFDTINIPIVSKLAKEKLDYEKKYSITDYILLFFTFSFIGWIWEVFYHLILDGTFVNRGTMFGPWLPIYGFGGLLMLILLKPLRNNHFFFFISCIILSGIIEYSTAWYLETFKHMKWWDYTGYFLNIQGRICLEGLIAFALGGSAVTYFVAPLLTELYKKIKPKLVTVLCIVLSVLFIFDFFYSSYHPNIGEGITFSNYKNEIRSASL